MYKYLLLSTFLILSTPALSEGQDLLKKPNVFDQFDLKTAVPVNTNIAIQEILVRNQPVTSYKIITVCRKSPVWCEGYYTAIIHSLTQQNRSFCLLLNKVGNQNNEGIKSIIESWLYRQLDSKKIKFSDAIYMALTEHKEC